MGDQIEERYLNITGYILSFYTIVAFIELIMNTGNPDGYLIRNSLTLVALLLAAFPYIKKYVEVRNTFQILYQMYTHNKLYGPRMFMAIQHEKIMKSRFLYIVGELVMSYHIIKDDDGDSYSVEYKSEIILEFSRWKSMWIRYRNHKEKSINYSVYMICDCLSSGSIPDYINVTIGNNYKIYVRLEEVGESYIHVNKWSAGLYKIKIPIPLKEIYQNSSVTIAWEYIINKNFDVKRNSTQTEYDFFILPSNYGRKVNKCRIFIDSDEEEIIINGYAVHRVNRMKEFVWEKVLDFYKKENCREYSLVGDEFQADAEGGHYIHITHK